MLAGQIQPRMRISMLTLLAVSAILLVEDAEAMFCTIGQEPDPASHNRYRWVIPVEDPCQCAEVRVGSLNTRTPCRPFKVTYYDTFLHTSDPVEIRKWLNCTEVSCRAYIEAGRSHGNGYYRIEPPCKNPSIVPIEVYCDQDSNGGGWMRFYYKSGPQTCTKYDEFAWSGELISCLGLDTSITRFAVSDDITTIDTEQSWILNNSSWSFVSSFHVCQDSACRSPTALSIPNADVIANLANCKTPSGASWSQDYAGGYASVAGTLSTNGNWERAFYGCGEYRHVGDAFTLRFGGGPSHTGEFVHTSCNDYSTDVSNRVTSKWDSVDVRAIWIKTKHSRILSRRNQQDQEP